MTSKTTILLQALMAVSCFLTSTSVYLLNPAAAASKYFLAAGLTIISMFPYTLYFIMPTNYKLMDGDGNYDYFLPVHL
jgi:hypothetical protein